MSQNIEAILISHAHKDAEYAKALVDMITVTRVEDKGVKIICSSYYGRDIPADVNIYDYLSSTLQGNVWVIYLLSKNYYNSAACLNEMGATWVQNKKYSTFITPNFEFSEIKGAVDPSKNAFNLNTKEKLNDFKNLLLEKFSLRLEDNIWESVRDTSLNTIKIIAKKELESSPTEKVEFETVKKSEGSQIKVILRVTNYNNFSMDLSFVKIQLKDSNGQEFLIEDEITDVCVHSFENKLIYRTYSLEDSNYSAARHQSVAIEDFKFHKAY
ncbi:toll/interleukin-1 receptor domain-containing protein [Bacillus sp. Brlt_9]|uniref:toll/interleukin-1 receptor domain-containing protein n=1 Tax=Bacillus sp. Brlt_9 TaxID=3110916 RepID=UPI003F7C2D66